MAKNRSAEGASRSELIRHYMSQNPTQSAQEVVAGLKGQGTIVTPGLVYQIKHARSKAKKAAARKMKRRAKARRRAAQHSAATNAAPVRGAKADAIREVARAIGKRVRPRDVRATLAERGIAVTWAQISSVLAGMGMRRRRRRRKPVASPSAPATSSTSAAVSIDDLVAAKKLANQLGGIDKAKAAISALARLS